MNTRIFLLTALALIKLSITFAINQELMDSLEIKYENASEDGKKLELLTQLYNRYLYKDAGKAMAFAFEQLNLSQKLGDRRVEAQANYHLGVCNANKGLVDSTKYYYSQAQEIATLINDSSLVARVNQAIAMYHFHRGNLDSAEIIAVENIELSSLIKDTLGVAISMDLVGMIHQNKGNYNISLQYFEDALELYIISHDSIRIADLYTHLAAVESGLKNYDKSIEYDLKALGIYERFNDIYYQSLVLNDIGVAYLMLEDMKKARVYFKRAMDKALEVNWQTMLGTINVNMGQIETNEGNSKEAFQYFNKALAIQTDLKETRKQIVTKNNMGKSYNHFELPLKALPVLTEVISIADSIHSKSILKNAYLYRSKSYELIDNYKASLEDYKKFKAWSDSLLNSEKLQQIEELRVIHDLKQKELQLKVQHQTIQMLNNEVELANLKKLIYSIGLLIMLLAGIMIVYFLNQRSKLRSREQERNRELLKKELEFKKKELTSQTLHLVQKNTLIQELKESLENIGKASAECRLEVNRMGKKLQIDKASEKDWEVFKTYFTEVHNTFDKQIVAINPNISENDLRMLYYIKMKLSTKEIAAMLNVMPESVLKAKYRLKKKLKLEKEKDLYQYISAI